MQIIRYADEGGVRVGVQEADGVRPLPVPALADLLALPADRLREELATAPEGAAPDAALAPVDPHTEVWAAGVTYEISRAGRAEESAYADLYLDVYDADRPELFFKAVGWRVRGPGETVGIRADSTWDVPEPDLALVCNAAGEVVGHTACNDVSSRSIEGANPLYLPQAKVYRHSCALGPWIRMAWAVADPYALGIEAEIRRGGETTWSGATSTASIHRRFPDLTGALFAGDHYPHGVVLATGTSAVPAADVTLAEGDVVTVRVEEVGALTNPVVRVGPGTPEESR